MRYLEIFIVEFTASLAVVNALSSLTIAVSDVTSLLTIIHHLLYRYTAQTIIDATVPVS
jgi:hypothetical protein